MHWNNCTLRVYYFYIGTNKRCFWIFECQFILDNVQNGFKNWNGLILLLPSSPSSGNNMVGEKRYYSINGTGTFSWLLGKNVKVEGERLLKKLAWNRVSKP